MRSLILSLAIATSALVLTACRNDTPPGGTPTDAEAPSPVPGAVTPDPAAPSKDTTPPAPAPSPANTVPARFQGTYASDAAACADPAHESRLAITADSMAFHESSGPVTKVASGENEISLTARLTGEGETREANYSFRLSDDDATLTDVGNAMVRHRCG